MKVNDRITRRTIFLALALALAACQAEPNGPEDTLRRFLADVRGHRSQAAWAALTPQNQTALRARYEASYRRAHPDAKDPSGLLFTELGLASLAEPKSVVVVSPLNRPEVRLRVAVEGGASASFLLHRTDAGWQVELLEALQPIPTPKPDAAPTGSPPGAPAPPNTAAAPPPPEAGAKPAPPEPAAHPTASQAAP